MPQLNNAPDDIGGQSRPADSSASIASPGNITVTRIFRIEHHIETIEMSPGLPYPVAIDFVTGKDRSDAQSEFDPGREGRWRIGAAFGFLAATFTLSTFAVVLHPVAPVVAVATGLCASAVGLCKYLLGKSYGSRRGDTAS